MKKFNAGLLILFLIFTFLASCDRHKGGTKSLRVRVVSFESDGTTSTRIPNTTVVLGNSDGSMITHGTTDTNGEYTFVDPPVNATVTAAFSCLQSGATYTTYSLNVVYDVNLPAITMWMTDCNKSPLGTITINAANSIGTATDWDIKMGDETYSTFSLASQHTYTVYPSMLQSDGKLSIAVIGNDSSGHPVGYGVLSDQTFTDGMTVNINVDKAMSYVQYNLTNIPSAVTLLDAMLGMWRKDHSISLDSDSGYLSSAVTTTTMNVAYIPGFGDRFDYFVWLGFDQNNNGYPEAFISLGNSAVPGISPSDQSFDFNQGFIIPTNLAVSYATGTTGPTFSWTGSDPNADQVYLNAAVYNNSGAAFLASMIAPPQRTSVVFPELPTSLAAYMPASVYSVSCGIWDTSVYSGYDDYLTKFDQWSTGSWSIPSISFTYRSSSAVYSSEMTYAPKLNKSRASILPMQKIMLRPY